MEEKNYLPFDYTRAKAGMPVITRNGDSVVFITFGLHNTEYPIAAMITDQKTGQQRVGAFTRDGRVLCTGEESPGDLVMKVLDIDTIKWSILYRGEDDEFKWGNSLFDTEEEAVKAISEWYNKTEDGTVVKTYPICTTQVRVVWNGVNGTNGGDGVNGINGVELNGINGGDGVDGGE